MPTRDPKYVWMNGEFVKWNEAKIHILSHVIHYGTGVFEGIRAYPSKNNLNIFRLKDHVKRLENSAKIYGMKCRYSSDEVIDVILKLLRMNGLRTSAYIRPIIYVSNVGIGLDFTGLPISCSIVVVPFDKYFSKEGLKVCVSSWRRISDASTPPLSKATGNYLNSALAKADAHKMGYDEAIMLDHRGIVSEGSGENIFMVNKGTVSTPSISSSILNGITRDSMMTIAEGMGIRLVEREVSRGELYTCDELFFTGTAAEVTAILEVDGRVIGDGRPGPLTRRLRSAYTDAVHGRSRKYQKWLTPVY